jgi:hypothetical protein
MSKMTREPRQSVISERGPNSEESSIAKNDSKDNAADQNEEGESTS